MKSITYFIGKKPEMFYTVSLRNGRPNQFDQMTMLLPFWSIANLSVEFMIYLYFLCVFAHNFREINHGNLQW